MLTVPDPSAYAIRRVKLRLTTREGGLTYIIIQEEPMSAQKLCDTIIRVFRHLTDGTEDYDIPAAAILDAANTCTGQSYK